MSSGSATGTAGYLVIQKLDTTLSNNNEPDGNATPLAGIEFKLIDPKTNKVIKTVTTDEDGYADFGRLLYGDYKLHEVNPPADYETPDQDKIITVGEEFTSESNPLDYVQTIVNYKEIEVVEIPVEKVWKGEVLEEVTVRLLDGEEQVAEAVLSADNDWTHTFKAPKLDEDGKEIIYTVDEVAVEGYVTTIAGSANEGFTVTNTRTGETEVPVEKVWKLFEKEETPVTVHLLANGEEADSIELSDDNDWKHAFTELDKFDSEGEPIEYTVEEVEIDGFKIEITGDAAEGFTITNTEIVELYPLQPITKVDVEKVWEDKDNKHEVRPNAITVNLLADGEEVDSIELSEDNNWTHRFNSLPKFSDEAFENAIEYTVEEVEVAEYKSAITGNQETGYTITNTVKDYAIGDYVWVDRNKDGIQDENETPLEDVKVELYDKDGNKIKETTTDKNGRYIFDELLSGDYQVKFTLTKEQQELYKFTKQTAGDETKVDSDADETTGLTREIMLNEDNEQLTKDEDYEYQDVKATEGIDPTWDAGVIELVDITITKDWVEKDSSIRPDAITVDLLANGKKVSDHQVAAKSDWTVTIKGLDKYDTDGKEIAYTIKEHAVSEYNTSIDGHDITNTRKTYALGDYVWIDRNKDGIQGDDEKVLAGVKVELFDENGDKVAETTTDKNGKYIFDELESGNYKVKFTLTEEQAKKYKFTKQNAGDDVTNDSDADENGWTTDITLNEDSNQLTKDYADQDVKASEGIDPTWDAGVIELVDITITKVWNDQDESARPKAITVDFLVNGEKKEELELTAASDWTVTIKGLDKYDTDGVLIDYTVEEHIVSEYNSEVHGFIITNTQKTYALGDYVWVDRNKDGIQDENEEVLEGVKVELFDENGNKVAETTTDENGRYIFDELPAGEYKVKFTLTKEQAKKYKFTKQNAGKNSANDSDADENGWTTDITLNEENKQLTKDYKDQDVNASEGIYPTWDAGVIELVDITITKNWVEKDSSIRPDAITVDLLANGKKVSDHQVTAKSDWTVIIEGLDKYDTDGKEIAYTIKEHTVSEYNNTSIDGYDITNTRKTYALGDYVWIDRNKDGIQDDNEEVLAGVKVELFDENGNKIAETTTDKNGKYLFDELESGKYKVKFTLTKEQAKKYKFTKQNAGENSANDSDADENGWTTDITLNEDSKQLTNDYEDQAFKASEGIDPRWDAGVIEIEKPVHPEKPEQDEQTPIKPKPEKPADKPNKGEGTLPLPNTATNTFNYMLIGFVLLLIGSATLLIRKRKTE